MDEQRTRLLYEDEVALLLLILKVMLNYCIIAYCIIEDPRAQYAPDNTEDSLYEDNIHLYTFTSGKFFLCLGCP